MAELKTKKTAASVSAFVANVADAQQRKDSRTLIGMMKKASGAKPRLWGPSIIGFGDMQYTYPSGKELAWFPIGFSPRKGSLSLYLGCDIGHLKPFLKKFGTHKTGKSCIYVKKLSDIDLQVLDAMIHATLDLDSTPATKRKRSK